MILSINKLFLSIPIVHQCLGQSPRGAVTSMRAVRPPPLQRSNSCEDAWAEADHEEVETVAEAFAVVGIGRSATLQPLNSCSGDEQVLVDVCLMAKGDPVPDDFEVLTQTPCGQRASINYGGTFVFLAVRTLPRQLATEPIMAITLVDTDRGEVPAPGFQSIEHTSAGERVVMSKLLCVSRRWPDPSDASAAAAPLVGLGVFRPDRHARELDVPSGFELVGHSLSPGPLGGGIGGGNTRHIAFRRAAPSGLLQTAFRASLLDTVERHERPTGERGATPMRRWDSDHSSYDSSWASALPTALPHFCMPQGAQVGEGER